MAQIEANGIAIEVERHGDPSAPVVLLVRGLGSQLIHWPASLIDGFVAQGFHVVTFDNRDTGLSQKFGDHGAPDFEAIEAALMQGKVPETAYTVHDMAADAVGVLDGLGIDAAHVLGMSMGGMITQVMAHSYPDRLKSATIVMSSSGMPDLPPATPEAAAALVAYPEDPDNRESVIDFTLEADRTWWSPGYPFDDDDRRALIGRAYDRCYYPEGVQRQYAGILAGRGRFAAHDEISVPVLVVHGTDDTLLPVEHGRDIAARIPGAEMVEIEGMGHDLEGAVPGMIVTYLTKMLEGRGLR